MGSACDCFQTHTLILHKQAKAIINRGLMLGCLHSLKSVSERGLLSQRTRQTLSRYSLHTPGRLSADNPNPVLSQRRRCTPVKGAIVAFNCWFTPVFTVEKPLVVYHYQCVSAVCPHSLLNRRWQQRVPSAVRSPQHQARLTIEGPNRAGAGGQ